jgi:hypothetical protein
VANETCCWSLVEQAISKGADVKAPLQKRIQNVIDALRALAGTDDSSDFLERFVAASADMDIVRAAAGKISQSITTIADLAMSAGMPPAAARRYASDWLATLQGALILQAFLGEVGCFSRTLERLAELNRLEKSTGYSSTS